MNTKTKMTRLGLFLMLAAGSGCGFISVNGRPLGSKAPANPTSAQEGEAVAKNTDASSASTQGTATAADTEPDEPPPVQVRRLVMKDLETAANLSGEPGQKRIPVAIESDRERVVEVFVVGGTGYTPDGDTGNAFADVRLEPEEPWQIEVSSRDDRGFELVVLDPDETPLDHRLVFGHPPAGATVEQRTLTDYSLFNTVFFIRATRDRLDPIAFAHGLFTTIDERFFVYATRPQKCSGAEEPLIVGEPLVARYAASGLDLQRANGQYLRCNDNDRNPYLSIERPQQVNMPPAVKPQVQYVENLWKEEEFAGRASSNPRIAKYLEHKAKVEACFDREWDELDPDHKASRYDVVEVSGGKVRRVEGLAEQINRKVDQRCGMSKLVRERTAIRQAIAKEDAKRVEKGLEEVAARFAK